MCATGHKYQLKYDGMHYMKILHAKPTDAGEIVVVAKNLSVRERELRRNTKSTFLQGEMQAKCNIDIVTTHDFR